MKKIKLTVIIVFTLFASLLYANEFVIESYKPLPSDQAARVYEKLDDNGDACAIIKVKTDIEKQLQFDSGLKLPHPAEKKYAGEYWVYVSPGEQSLRIMAEGFTPKRISLTSNKIKSHQTYEILIKAKEENKVTVSILSDPSDAEKWIDDELLGTGNNFEIKIGQQKLEVRKSGYKTYSKTITVDKKNILFRNITLVEIEPVAMQIISIPSGADIYIDNIHQGKSNIGMYLYPGTYYLKLIKSSYVEVSEEMTIEEGSQNKFSYILKKNTGIVTLNICPSDAKILVNKADHTGKKELELAPGTYMIELSKPGYIAQSQVVGLKRGEMATVSVQLVQKVGRLQLSISPLEASCQLKQKGKVIRSWTGMNQIKDIPVGDYEIECKCQEYKTKKQKITISENQTKIVSLQMEEGTSYDNISGMIFVQGGTFKMGSNNGDDDEKPIHTVTVSDYYIGKYEVTQELYQKIMGRNPSSFKGDKRPVETVSWEDAVRFCNKLSVSEGLQSVYIINGTNVRCDFSKNGYRLPTEAEWEYAARGGSKSKGYTYSGSNTIGNVVWYYNNSGSKTQLVGKKQSNELGLYDMSGNVWEWCWDRSKIYSSIGQSNPTGPTSGSTRVLRGGSWSHGADICRVAYRYYGNPSNSRSNYGFRLVLSSGS